MITAHVTIPESAIDDFLEAVDNMGRHPGTPRKAKDLTAIELENLQHNVESMGKVILLEFLAHDGNRWYKEWIE